MITSARALSGFKERRQLTRKGVGGNGVVVNNGFVSQPFDITGITRLHEFPSNEPLIATVTADGGFCSTYHNAGTTYLRGGVVSAGPANHTISDFTLTSGNYYVWLTVSIVANNEDGVLLPGIESSSSASISTGASYPSSVIPTASTPNGTVIVPLGQVTNGSGSVDFAPHGKCSPVIISHCPGQVSY